MKYDLFSIGGEPKGHYMDRPIESEKYQGLNIEIFQDDNAWNPRAECDCFGSMVCFHRNYDLGDKNHDYCTPESLTEAIDRGKLLAIPLFLYDHSGITIRCGDSNPFSCPWDSGQLGYIVVSHEKILKEFNRKHITPSLLEKARKILVGEVKCYDNYITGNVYGYRITNNDGNELDSCWGYIGDSDYCLEEAKRVVDCMTNKGSTDHNGQLLMKFAKA